mmetsp:Transcript_10556/g.42672  ORF Transcript_10556/g.42672 Transcript_10556/m.42672 type:complete len:217 (+) Transcript_10556:657-1307(+)
MLPHVTRASRAAEIGSGGGRVAVRLARAVGALALFDVSAKMLDRARAAVDAATQSCGPPSRTAPTAMPPSFGVVEYHHVTGDGDASPGDDFSDDVARSYPLSARAAFDLVVCFDVMVHMDLHTIFRCLKRIRALLKPPHGRAFISTANLAAPDGWARFAKQARFTVGGFYFVTPDAVRLLVDKAGLVVLSEQTPDATNTYYNRDYLALLGLPQNST